VVWGRFVDGLVTVSESVYLVVFKPPLGGLGADLFGFYNIIYIFAVTNQIFLPFKGV